MKGSNLTRVCRVVNDLLLTPKHIPKYFKYSMSKQTPIDFGLPWISFGAIEFLNKWPINEDTEILELGGGGSTIFFGKKKAHVTCLESSVIWAERLSTKCKENNLINVDIKIFEYDYSNQESFLESDFYHEISSKKYDIILVDNYEEDVLLRPACFYNAEKSIKEGGIIILDDSWRYSRVREFNSAKKHVIFKSIGPCRYGVTSTDIFFY
jgi:hypothetical protein